MGGGMTRGIDREYIDEEKDKSTRYLEIQK